MRYEAKRKEYGGYCVVDTLTGARFGLVAVDAMPINDDIFVAAQKAAHESLAQAMNLGYHLNWVQSS